MSILPEQFRWIVRFNPVRSILEVFRDPIYFGKMPPLVPPRGGHRRGAASRLFVGAVAFRRSSRPHSVLRLAPPSRYLRASPAPPVIELRDVSLCYRLAQAPLALVQGVRHPPRARRAIVRRRCGRCATSRSRSRRGETVGDRRPQRRRQEHAAAGHFPDPPARPPDSVRVRGRVAPILELGTGFDLELTGCENVFLNALLLGHTGAARSGEKLDEIVEFSGLGDFIDSPLRNYSTGMLARLGFSIATCLAPGDPDPRRSAVGGRRVLRPELRRSNREPACRRCDDPPGVAFARRRAPPVQSLPVARARSVARRRHRGERVAELSRGPGGSGRKPAVTMT